MYAIVQAALGLVAAGYHVCGAGANSMMRLSSTMI